MVNQMRVPFTGMLSAYLLLAASELFAQDLPLVSGVELQPLTAQVERIVQALALTGSPLGEDQQADINSALSRADKAAALRVYPKMICWIFQGFRPHVLGSGIVDDRTAPVVGA